jgi:uncharacterized protein YjbI with pentapeptide repeats
MIEAESGDIESTIESETFSRETDFRDRDLRGCDFSGDTLKNANFSGADLRGCCFVDTDLSEANFQGAKIGVDGDRASRLLTAGFISALGYVFLVALFVALVELIQLEGRIDEGPSNFPSGFGNTDSEGETTKDGNYIDSWTALRGTGITAYITVAILCFLVFVAITSFLFLGYVNADSIDEAYILIPVFLAIASVCLTIAITKVRDLSQTDFSGANLDLVQVDRSSFQTAKTSEAAIDRTIWL